MMLGLIGAAKGITSYLIRTWQSMIKVTRSSKHTEKCPTMYTQAVQENLPIEVYVGMYMIYYIYTPTYITKQLDSLVTLVGHSFSASLLLAPDIIITFVSTIASIKSLFSCISSDVTSSCTPKQQQ